MLQWKPESVSALYIPWKSICGQVFAGYGLLNVVSVVYFCTISIGQSDPIITRNEKFSSELCNGALSRYLLTLC